MNQDTTRSAERSPGGPATGQVGWRLHVAVSPCPRRVGTVYELGVGVTVLGRAPEGGGGFPLQFDDPLMSRRHLTLVHRGGHDALELQDLQSRNGTWLGGRAVQRGRIGHGAVLRVGGTLLLFESDLGRNPAFAEPTAEVPGRSETARMLRAELHLAARDALPCLITGETGTGKEFAALELH